MLNKRNVQSSDIQAYKIIADGLLIAIPYEQLEAFIIRLHEATEWTEEQFRDTDESYRVSHLDSFMYSIFEALIDRDFQVDGGSFGRPLEITPPNWLTPDEAE